MEEASVVLTVIIREAANERFRGVMIDSAGGNKFERFNYDQRTTLECGNTALTEGLTCIQFLEPLGNAGIEQLLNELDLIENQVAKSLRRDLVGFSRHWFVNQSSMDTLGTEIQGIANASWDSLCVCGVDCIILSDSLDGETEHSTSATIIVTDPEKSESAELELLLQGSNSPLFLRDLMFHKINWIHGPRPQVREKHLKLFVDEMIDGFVSSIDQASNSKLGKAELDLLWPKALTTHAWLLSLRMAKGTLPFVFEQIQMIRNLRIPIKEVAFVASSDAGLEELFTSLELKHNSTRESVEKCTKLVAPLLEVERELRDYASHNHERKIQKASKEAGKHLRILEAIIAAASVGIGVAALLPENVLVSNSPVVDFSIRLLLSFVSAAFVFCLIWFYQKWTQRNEHDE